MILRKQLWRSRLRETPSKCYLRCVPGEYLVRLRFSSPRHCDTGNVNLHGFTGPRGKRALAWQRIDKTGLVAQKKRVDQEHIWNEAAGTVGR